MNYLIATPWNESSGTCDCCDHSTQKIWGDISSEGKRLAVYFVQWTVGQPEHYPNIDLIIGAWGDGTDASNRILVSLLYRPSTDGGSFMIVDAQDRVQLCSTVSNRGMLRAEVIGTPLANEVFDFVDSIWLTDYRIEGVKALNQFA